MSHPELERPLEAEALREIERSLYGKLKAHRLPDTFIERCGEEALQRGLIEYVRVLSDGREIENRDAFIVDAAFKRAIDELRREARRADAVAIEAILEEGHASAPSTDEIAIEHLQAEELHEAMETLSPEERQVLSLYFFEQRSAEDSAHLLHLSERSFRRRLKKTITTLSEQLGVEIPEQGSGLAIEIGLVAWVTLRGARVPVSAGPLEPVISVFEGARHGAAWALERIRDLATRTTASGNGERIGAIASGPVGKVTGACAGTLAICALTGVVGPGVGGVDLLGEDAGQPPAHHRISQHPTPPPRISARAPREVGQPVEQTPITAPTKPREEGTRATSSEPTAAEKRTKRANNAVASQQLESEVPEASESPAPESSSSAPSESSSGSAPSPTQAASEGLTGGTGL